MAFLMADLGVLVDKESGKQMSRDVRKLLDVSRNISKSSASVSLGFPNMLM